MRRPRPSVRLRLTAMYTLVFLAAGAVLLGVNYTLVRAGLPDDELVFEAIAPTEMSLVAGDASEDVIFINGLPVEGFNATDLPPEIQAELDAAAESGYVVVDQVPTDLVGGPTGAVDSGYFVLSGQTIPAATVAELPSQTRDRALRELLTQSLIALGVMAVVSVGLGWWMSGRALRPLHRITATARRLGEQDLHERIALEGPNDELKELADTFDGMLGRLESAFGSQKRFAANASHQLRTPLAIMRAEVDVTLDDPDATVEDYRAMAERVRQATDRSEELVSSLLLLARSERVLERHDPCDLAAAAELAGASVRAAAGVAGVEVTLRCDPAPVRGDGALLDEALVNLVDNAVRYNRAGGWVHVTSGVLEGRSFVRVANSGPVIAADEVEQLFEPFRRGEARSGERPGSGLGLSIVRSVAGAHGGSVAARAFSNGGLEVTLSIPVATDDPVAP